MKRIFDVFVFGLVVIIGFVWCMPAAGAAEVSELQGITGKIGQEDIEWGSGEATDTYTVPSYSGSDVTLTRVPSLAVGTASRVKGRWYVSTDATVTDHCDNSTDGSLAWIVSQLAGANADVELPGDTDYIIGQNCTIPSNVRLIKQPGAVFTATSPVALTINRKPDLGVDHTFDDNVSVHFAAGISPILGEWFGSDLYRAYQSATSGSIINYYGAQTISQQIVMTKANVSIDGGNAGQTYPVTLPAGFSGDSAIQYMDHTLEWDTMGYVTIRNMHIDVDDKANYGVLIYGGYFGGLENVSIVDAVLDGVRFDLSGALVWNKVYLDNVVTFSPGRYCLSAFNKDSDTSYEGMSVNRFTCWLSGDTGVYLETTYPYRLGVHFKDLWLEGVGRHGIHSKGQVFWDVDGGWVEWNPYSLGDNSTGHRNIKMEYSTYAYGGIAKVNRWQVVGTTAGNLPYIDEFNTLHVCDSQFTSTNHQRQAECYTLGRFMTDVANGGPYLDVKTSTGAITQRDVYGKRWMSVEGNDTSDGNESTIPLTKWRALDLPIIIPFSYDDFSDNTTLIWYPRDDFILTNVSFMSIDAWTCAGTVSFGVHDYPYIYIDPADSSALNTSAAIPLQSKLSSNSDNRNYNGAYWRMYSMSDYAPPMPNLGETFTYNHISAYTSGGDCTAGSGIVIIEGFYINPLTQYSTP